MDTERRQLVIEPLPAAEPQIGRWLGVLQDTRVRTKETLAGMDPRALDWPVRHGNAIGTLLAHIAAIEMDWLYAEVLEQEFPPEVLALLPPDVRDERGNLWVVTGLTLDEHLRRLDATRAILIAAFREMTLDDFQRARHLPNYDVTPEWVVHHLSHHEAGHRSDIITVLEAHARAVG